MRSTKILVVVFCAMVMALAANANTITHTINFGDSFDGFFNIDEVLSVPQFDASFGPLQSVTIDFGVASNGTIKFHNMQSYALDANLSTSFYCHTDNELKTSNGNLNLIFNGISISSVDWDDQETYTFSVDAWDGIAFDWDGPWAGSAEYMDEASNGSLFYNDNLAAFIGNGNLEFNLVGQAMAALSGPGTGAYGMTTIGSGYATVTYEYVPEPATIALLGLGGLALIRKKRNA